MDASELHYVDYDPEKVWDEMINTYLDAGGDIIYGGDEKEILLRAVLAIATAVMAKVDSALRMDTLTYATGEYLKEYGLKRNCVFIDAVAATAPVTLTFEPSGVQQTIEAGTELTEDGTVIYVTTEDIDQTGTAQIVETKVRCQTPGIIGNGLYAGAQLQFIRPVEGLLTAIVSGDASGGVDEEDEEVYRERIRNFGLASITTGPEQQYESAALAVSTQIIDARAINDGGGEVGVYLILAEGADQSVIFTSVQLALSDITVRPLTDHVTVKAANNINYTLNVKVWYSTYSALGPVVNSTIAEYKTWQDNRIGRAFNPDKLMAMLYQAGCERVQFLSGSGISGASSPEYTEIALNAHCKGTINLTVVNT